MNLYFVDFIQFLKVHIIIFVYHLYFKSFKNVLYAIE